MICVSLDIETTGLDISWCQILEIGATIFDTTKGLEQFDSNPKWKCIVDNGKQIQGEPYAINMNARIFKILADLEDYDKTGEGMKEARVAYRNEYNILTPGQVADSFWEWLLMCRMSDIKVKIGEKPKKEKIYITVCGKNAASFDVPFLKEKIPSWNERIRIRTRILDPSILFIEKADEEPPGLEMCMARARMNGIVTHDALQDAIDTAKITLIGLDKLTI